jgi:hypothetical protein
VPPHQGAQSGRGENLLLLRLPAQEPRGGGEREVLGEQAGPLLQRAGGDDPGMHRERGVGRHDVAARVAVDQHLARQGKGPQAAGDDDRPVPVAAHVVRWEARAVGDH